MRYDLPPYFLSSQESPLLQEKFDDFSPREWIPEC
jgi:hypothetical protein